MVITLFATHYENKLMIASRRWRSLVCCLRKEGVDICVVTSGAEDQEYLGEYGEIVIVFKSLLAKKDYATGSKAGQARKVIHTPFPYFDVSALHWLGAVRNRRVAFHCSNSDILISTYGPAGAMLVGLWFSRKNNIPWVLDLRDSFQLPASFTLKPLLWLNKKIEKFIVSKAVLRLTVGEVLADYLSDKYRSKFEFIYNGWLETDAIACQQATEIRPFFIYAGSIYGHQLNSLKVFLEGMLTQEEIVLRIRLIKDYSGRLNEWLAENNFENRVDIYGAIPSDELKKEMHLSTGVLVLEELKPNSWQKGTVTGKLFSLLVSGVPGVVISHPDVELYTLASKAKGWFCGYDKESARQAVLSVIECDRNELEKNQGTFKEYQFTNQSKKLLKLCRGAINEHS